MPSMGMPSMPSLPTPSMPSMPSLPTPSLPSLPSFPAAPDAPAKGGGDIVRGLDLPPLFAPGTSPSLPSFPVLPKEEPTPPAEDTRAVEARRRAEALASPAPAAPTPKDEGAAPAEALPFSLPSPSNLPSVAGPGAIWGGLGGGDAAAPKRDDGPALSLPKLPAPSLPSLPGVPGLPALPKVEINPIANIA